MPDSIGLDPGEQRLDLRLGVGVEILMRLGDAVHAVSDVSGGHALALSVVQHLIDGRNYFCRQPLRTTIGGCVLSQCGFLGTSGLPEPVEVPFRESLDWHASVQAS